MGRGSNLADGGVTIDEGEDWAGVRTRLHFEGDQLIVQRTQDMQPILDFAKQARESQEGKRYRDGFTHVGVIPNLDYYRLIAPIRDRKKRSEAIRQYFRDRSQFSTFDKAHRRV